jgi:hypothetical protein
MRKEVQTVSHNLIVNSLFVMYFGFWERHHQAIKKVELSLIMIFSIAETRSKQWT